MMEKSKKKAGCNKKGVCEADGEVLVLTIRVKTSIMKTQKGLPANG